MALSKDAFANIDAELATTNEPLANEAAELALSYAVLACVLTHVSVELLLACKKAALAVAYAALAVFDAYGSTAPPPVIVVISTLANFH